jgi:hypothetical protein
MISRSAVTVSTGIRSLDIEEELDITKHALEEATIRAVSAEARMELLEKDLHHHIGTPKSRKPVRIYIDGCVSYISFSFHSRSLLESSCVCLVEGEGLSTLVTDAIQLYPIYTTLYFI